MDLRNVTVDSAIIPQKVDSSKAVAARPLAIDLFCGLGGWTEGLLAEGYHARGFDIEAHEYGEEKYPGELVLADVMTLHGSQFADAALIVASPPCQEFSYMAMPWSRAKQIARALRGNDTFPEGYTGSRTIAELTALFDACFRIQREASAAAGRHIPMVVENVRGCVPWVGPAAWNYGSYYLWGDVPALMPSAHAIKNGELSGGSWFNIGSPGQKVTGANPVALAGWKVPSDEGPRTDAGKGARFTSRDCGIEGVKGAGAGWFNDAKRSGGTETGYLSRTGSKSPARKAASAKIAKIPLPLSRWIAKTYRPQPIVRAA
jgi:hypothetical protein